MLIPLELNEHPFREWNRSVKCLVDVWELARSMGLEKTLEKHLAHDDRGHISMLLTRLAERCDPASVPNDPVQYTTAKSDLLLSLSMASAEYYNGNEEIQRRRLEAYLEAAHNGHCPDDLAYQGGEYVREFLVWIEQFRAFHEMDAYSFSLLAKEAFEIYAGLRLH